MKFVFHVDEVCRWQVALSSIKNTVRYLKEHQLPIVIDVVTNSEAVQVFAPEVSETKGFLETFHALLDDGVHLLACQNALDASGLAKENLLAKVEVVPASMIHLAVRQSEGYAYIRP